MPTTSTGNLLTAIATCMSQAGIDGYTGVLYLYHRSSTQVVVQWTGQEISRKNKVKAEQYLLDLATERGVHVPKVARNNPDQTVTSSSTNQTVEPPAPDNEMSDVTEYITYDLVSSNATKCSNAPDGTESENAYDGPGLDGTGSQVRCIDPISDLTEPFVEFSSTAFNGTNNTTNCIAWPSDVESSSTVSNRANNTTDCIAWPSDVKIESSHVKLVLPTDFEVVVNEEDDSRDLPVNSSKDFDVVVNEEDDSRDLPVNSSTDRCEPTASESRYQAINHHNTHGGIHHQNTHGGIHHQNTHGGIHADWGVVSPEVLSAVPPKVRGQKKQRLTHWCAVCFRRFAGMHDLIIHNRSHTGERPYSCSVCNKIFTAECAMKRHRPTHPRKSPTTVCNTAFSHQNTLRDEQTLRTKHYTDEVVADWKNLNQQRARTGDRERTFSHAGCSKPFASLGLLQNHHKHGKQNRCTECSKSATAPCTHVKPPTDSSASHAVCNQAFDDTDALQEPQPTKARLVVNLTPVDGVGVAKWKGRKTSYCTLCDKTFTRRHTLIAHQRIHTGEKPYSCALCNKTFRRKIGLKSHQKSHTGERPYQCNICDKSYKWKNDLVRHQKTRAGKTPFSCTEGSRHRRTHRLLTMKDELFESLYSLSTDSE